MVETPRYGKLAVLLHADIAGSTELVHEDEHIAHERIQDTFQRFSDTIVQYHGHVRELRGDALLAEFERSSDAVTAALAFQADQAKHNAKLNDNIRPGVRVGIAMGEVIVAEHTVTGAGVVLAQRVEQLAEPGGTCITAAIHESMPQRMPFDQEDLGEHQVKGFKDPIRVYGVQLTPGQSIPAPQARLESEASPNTRGLIVTVAVIALVVVAGAAFWFKPWEAEEAAWSTQFPPNDPTGRGGTRTGVKLGQLNLRIEVPTRWDTQVIEERDLNLQGFVTSKEQLPYEFARLLDGTIKSTVLVATDREEVAHFRVFKLYKWIDAYTSEAAIKWMHDRGVQLIIDRYVGTTSYDETRGSTQNGTLGSGEAMTMIPSVLRIGEGNRNVWTVFVLRPNSSIPLYEYIVFFFRNGADTREIEKNLILEITNFATKMF